MQMFKEQWVRPRAAEKELIGQLIDCDELVTAGTGIAKHFEEKFGAYIGSRYTLAFSHGTAALAAAYYAIGVGPGDEVITPALGYIASYAGALHMGARPVFCDIDPHTLLIDPHEVEKKITSRTKAINIIHLNGRVCDLEALLKISQEYDIPLIEDASHAHGAEWAGKKIGNNNHITCFSLNGVNPNGKPVSGGEGGIATTNNFHYYQGMLAYCHLHRHHILEELKESPYQELDEEVLGLKWRPHALGMGIALISLQSLDERNAKRSVSYQETKNSLNAFNFLTFPKAHEKAKWAGFHGNFKLIYEGKLPAEEFVRSLRAEGIPISGPHAGYLEHRRSLFAKGFDLWGRDRGPLKGSWEGLDPYQPTKEFPHADAMERKVLTLPAFIDVDPEYYVALKAAAMKAYG